MKVTITLQLSIALGVLMLASPIFAHHGVAAYDESKTITMAGTVAEFRFANPHTLISLNVKDGRGNLETWVGELTSRNSLERLGWTSHSLQEGAEIKIIGHPSKIGPRIVWVTKVVLPGGRTLDAIDDN